MDCDLDAGLLNHTPRSTIVVAVVVEFETGLINPRLLYSPRMSLVKWDKRDYTYSAWDSVNDKCAEQTA